MVDNITGKNILLICYPFFGYDEAIRDELYKIGAKTVFLKKAEYFASSPRDEHFYTPWYKIPLNYLRAPKARTKWTENLKQEIEGICFDILLVIENTCFKKSFISYIKQKNPNIKTIWFLWDTFRTQQKWHRDYIPLFDKVYSFDRDDAKKYNLEYYPDFYIEPEGVKQHRYDICFVGSANETVTCHRIELLSKIKKQCDLFGLKSFFYLRYYNNSVSNPIRKVLRNIKGNKYQNMVQLYQNEHFMHKDALPLDQYNVVMRDSDIILDLNYKDRQGMTINAVLALASGKKLITTNYRIKEETFYHPHNILVVDENEPIIPRSFLDAKYIPIDMSCLRLDNWLKHIINF